MPGQPPLLGWRHTFHFEARCRAGGMGEFGFEIPGREAVAGFYACENLQADRAMWCTALIHPRLERRAVERFARSDNSLVELIVAFRKAAQMEDKGFTETRRVNPFG